MMATRCFKAFVIASGLTLSVLVHFDRAAAQLAGADQGIANRAVGRLANLNQNVPGYLYYGINGADRGLGYIGSYMTLGGFVPFAEDDMGGVWNADLRSHLSVNGGFFSNVGAVRKQLLGGGSLLGFGIYWDYDGDLNQYSAFDTPGALFGQFGHVYQQVGVSGELLTDWGNLRSNGYIPVGTTGYQLATNTNDGGLFYQHYILPQNGLDAALGGADLELGAYVPALADWAGMINVGGYAFGNTRYTKVGGPNNGGDLVPWFGGVYTRLDLTFANNWDFSLQYNNDSFFDSTGFARLTYRMGGSRRRNVPDQMEQPMFRNEHIVRAHETPLVALNPENDNKPWQVIHIDNSAFPNGDGTAERPFETLAEGQGSSHVQSDPWTIAYVHQGLSSVVNGIAINPYAGSFTFQQPNQFLVGSGGPLTIATQPIDGSSLFTIPQMTAARPVLTNKNTADALGASVVIANDKGGVTIANLQTVGSVLGIDASGKLSSGIAQPVGTTANPYGTANGAAGGAAVRNVSIVGDGTSAQQRGVRIAGVINGAGTDINPGTAPRGNIEFSDTSIENTTRTAFQVGAFNTTVPPPVPIPGSGGDASIDYYGRIANNTAENGNFTTTLLEVVATTGGMVNLAATATPLGSTVPNQILDVGGQGILIRDNDAATNINIANTTLVNTTPTAIAVVNDNATTAITTVATSGYPYGISKSEGNATIAITGGSPQFSFFGTVNNSSSTIPNGPIIGIRNVANADINIAGPGVSPLLSTAGGVEILNADTSNIAITGLDLRGNRPTGIEVTQADGTTLAFTDTSITGSTTQGILLDQLGTSAGQPTSATFDNLSIALNNAGTIGVHYQNSTTSGTVSFEDTVISGATAQGVLIEDVVGPVVFNNTTIALSNTAAIGIHYRNSTTTGTNMFQNTTISGTTAQGVLLEGLTGGTTAFDTLAISGATAQGVLLADLGGTTVFNNLAIDLASNNARGFEAVNANTVYTTGTNTIANASTTLAAIYIDGNTSLAGPGGAALNFRSVQSGNTQATGVLTGLTLTSQGAGYPISSTLSVDAASPTTNGGTTARVDATTNATGQVTGLAVTTGGSGYAVGDTVTLPPSNPAIGVSTDAEATVATTSEPAETAITINQPTGGASGTIRMQIFTVGGAAGSGVNVINNGVGVAVEAGGNQISP